MKILFQVPRRLPLRHPRPRLSAARRPAQRISPTAPEPLELIRPNPRMCPRALALLVGPPSDGASALEVVWESGGHAPLGQLVGTLDMRLMPTFNVPRVGKKVPLLRVAAAVRQHQIVTEIGRI